MSLFKNLFFALNQQTNTCSQKINTYFLIDFLLFSFFIFFKFINRLFQISKIAASGIKFEMTNVPPPSTSKDSVDKKDKAKYICKNTTFLILGVFKTGKKSIFDLKNQEYLKTFL